MESLLQQMAYDLRGDPEVKAVAKVAMRVAARPTLLNAKIAARIVKYMLEGAHLTTAVQACGYSNNALRKWVARGEEWIDSEQPVPENEIIYCEFIRAVRLAESQCELRLLRRAVKGDKDWKAVMTVLERRFGPRWAKQETLQPPNPDDDKPPVVMVESDDERRQRVAKILDEASALSKNGKP